VQNDNHGLYPKGYSAANGHEASLHDQMCPAGDYTPYVGDHTGAYESQRYFGEGHRLDLYRQDFPESRREPFVHPYTLQENDYDRGAVRLVTGGPGPLGIDMPEYL
jgi:hypothetical protein